MQPTPIRIRCQYAPVFVPIKHAIKRKGARQKTIVQKSANEVSSRYINSYR